MSSVACSKIFSGSSAAVTGEGRAHTLGCAPTRMAGACLTPGSSSGGARERTAVSSPRVLAYDLITRTTLLNRLASTVRPRGAACSREVRTGEALRTGTPARAVGGGQGSREGAARQEHARMEETADRVAAGVRTCENRPGGDRRKSTARGGQLLVRAPPSNREQRHWERARGRWRCWVGWGVFAADSAVLTKASERTRQDFLEAVRPGKKSASSAARIHRLPAHTQGPARHWSDARSPCLAGSSIGVVPMANEGQACDVCFQGTLSLQDGILSCGVCGSIVQASGRRRSHRLVMAGW